MHRRYRTPSLQMNRTGARILQVVGATDENTYGAMRI